MNTPVIETNFAFEFIYNLMGIAYYETKNPSTEDLSTQRFAHFVTGYIHEIYNDIPHMVRNDIHLFLNDFSSFYVSLLHIVINETIQTPLELIERLRNMDIHEFLNLYLEGNEIPLQTDSPKDALDSALDELTKSRHDLAKDKELFYEFLEFGSVIMKRLDESFSYYYRHFFQPQEAELDRQLKRLQKHHQMIYDDNPEGFINSILFQSKESLNDSQTEIHIYLGYYYGDRISVAYGSKHEVYFFYGASAEKKLYSENHRIQYDELIKSLADDTRRNLIRFLMNSPHYNKEIADHLGITTATISYHISRLVDIGIIHLKYQEGKRIYYQVDMDRFNQLFDGLRRYLISSVTDY